MTRGYFKQMSAWLRSTWGARHEDGDAVYVTKVDDAEPFVGDLFRATFGDPVPSIPTHYVAFVRTNDGRFVAAGYYHVSYHESYALVGGLCVDPRLRGRGIGERLETYVYRDAGEIRAYFAHVGDPKRARRVGFIETTHPHLMANWVRTTAEDDRRSLEAQVAALGPF